MSLEADVLESETKKKNTITWYLASIGFDCNES